MKQCLVDVSVLVGLLAPRHEHHSVCRKWHAGLLRGEARVCRMVQLGVVRLLANRTVMAGDVQAPLTGWRTTEALLRDERMNFIAEPDGLDNVLPRFLDSRNPAHNLVSDAYLAAFAIAGSLRVATLDRGFQQFRGLDVDLLA